MPPRQSQRWTLLATVAQALADAPELAGVPLFVNPSPETLRLSHNQRCLVLRWTRDVRAGERNADRSLSFVLGAVVGAGSSDVPGLTEAQAWADYLSTVADEAVTRAMEALNADAKRARPTADEVTPDLQGEFVSGSMVLTAWRIDYRSARTI